MKEFLQLHASGISMILGGVALYVIGNHADGIAMVSAGMASFGIKVSTAPKAKQEYISIPKD